MNAIRLRERAKRRIDALPAHHLTTAVAYLDFLEHREEEDATAELRRIPGFSAAMAEAAREIAAGRLTPAAGLRRKRAKHV